MNENVKIYAETIEEEAIKQIETLVNETPFKNSIIRIMPDAHAGAGCVIGFVAYTCGAIIPNIVGVDIGCGMLTVELGDIFIDYEQLDQVIRKFVPSGFAIHDKESAEAKELVSKLGCEPHLPNKDRAYKSLGTLGGGNHFIEIDEDEDGCKYLIIHTGSRNLGKQVAEYYQQLAIDWHYNKESDKKELIERLKAKGREKEISTELEKLKQSRPPKDLCWLEHPDDYFNYIDDMEVCQEYAKKNRIEIAATIMGKMGWLPKASFETVHNYITGGVIRKGAIRAEQGERVLIPMNMKDGCIIGVGKGNEDWLCSAPHGAGRIMSRKKARETLDIAEYKDSMFNIFSSTVCEATIDEAPQAYKDTEEIKRLIEPTVTIEKIIHPVYNFKATE